MCKGVKKRYILFTILLIIWPIISFSIIYTHPPTSIRVDPVSINGSFTGNDSSNILIKNVIIRNIGPDAINLYIGMEGNNNIRNTNNYKKNNSSDSYINISLTPYPLMQVKGGYIKFLSVKIDASKAYLKGDYKGVIIINTTGEKIHEIIPMTLEIVDAKSRNNNSISTNTDKKDNKTANGKTDSL